MSERISIKIDSELFSQLEKRAEKNHLSVREMAEDIVRRSMVSYKGGPSRSRQKIDDKLVGIFSRERRGRKRKKKK